MSITCPHCNTVVSIDWEYYYCPVNPLEPTKGGYRIDYELCPNCCKLILNITHGNTFHSDAPSNRRLLDIDCQETVYPKFPSTMALHHSIPEKYATIYKESEQVNHISPRASATLSRYLLQMILHEELHISKRNLAEEIEALEQLPHIPSVLVTMLQVMRRVANFGAHPKKSTHSNEIIEVEKGEADVMLEVLRELFDHLFVKPQQQKDFLETIKEKYGIE